MRRASRVSKLLAIVLRTIALEDTVTVISAVISRYCTAHASDSLISELRPDGTCVPREWKQTKIVAVPHCRGAMAYWGLARYGQWSTLAWLQERVQRAHHYPSPEDFAREVTGMLNKAISRMTFQRPLYAGIGIHFTAYEYVDNYWIPELFLLTNFKDPSYQSLHSDGVRLTRETYHTITNQAPQPEHREPQCRLRVHQHLQEGGRMLLYNNGDPALFNQAAGAILAMIRELARRGNLANAESVATYRAIARRPIEIVSRVQHDFAQEGARVVGGRPHDLAVTPNGEYSSDSGDV